jgi:hypothetical protein
VILRLVMVRSRLGYKLARVSVLQRYKRGNRSRRKSKQGGSSY